MIDVATLKDLKIDENKIIELGFVKQGNKFVFSKKIVDDEFLLNIAIENNVITSTVTEIAENEPFALYDVEGQVGAFVGAMRKEYANVMAQVKNNCCNRHVFKTEQANLIIRYVKNKYGDEAEYLWDKFPQNAIFRNKTNNKWYGALLVVEQRKIGIDKDGKIEIVDLLMQSDQIEKFVDNKKYFAGYHMNKKHWITLVLDQNISTEEICQLLDNSYQLSLRKKGKL